MLTTRMATTAIRAACRAYGALSPGSPARSRPGMEGNAGTMGLAEKLWWGHKFFVGAVERGEPAVEQYFAEQARDHGSADRALPAGFEVTSTVQISSGGDLLTSEHIRPDTTDHLWDEVADFLFDVDLAVANLETPVAPSRPAGAPPTSILSAPPLNSSVEMLDRIAGPGRFGLLTTANNHALDQGALGVVETLDELDARGCLHVGTARTYAERDDIPVVDIDGVRVAFLSYTFSVNGRRPAVGEEHLVNHLRLNLPDVDLSMVARHVEIARAEHGADLVVACVHWSLEFESYPVQTVIDNGHRLAALGIDAILGNHPHVIQPVERYRFADPLTGLEKDALIVYAHGDLLSWVTAVPNSMLGVAVRFTVVKGTEAGRPSTRITAVDHVPFYRQATFHDGRCIDFRLRRFDADTTAPAPVAAQSSPSGAERARLAALAARILPGGTAADALSAHRTPLR